jgi:chloramphenicol O-acetyltransferase type A
MRQIDLKTWGRKEHFELFRRFDQPHFGMCANVDVTSFYPYIKKTGVHFTSAFVYILSRCANAIASFRQRIRGQTVIEHEVVHPSFTVLVDEELFGFCFVEHDERYSVFAERARKSIADAKTHPTLAIEPARDDLLLMTAIPWVSFTSFLHPLPTTTADSFPRFAWGKRFEDGARLSMSLGVQAHHALMDGLHVGNFYAAVQECLSNPSTVLHRD